MNEVDRQEGEKTSGAVASNHQSWETRNTFHTSDGTEASACGTQKLFFQYKSRLYFQISLFLNACTHSIDM